MRRSQTTVRALLVGLGAALVLALGSTPASAHNVLRTTAPANGQTVEHAPASVVLTFDQPAIAMGTQIVVTGPDGEVATGAPRLVDNTVAQDLQPGIPAGRYAVSWRVTSADGHPVSGTFAFSASAAAPGTRPSPTPTPTAAPGDPGRREPLVPSWGWIAAGVLVILGAVRLARRSRDT